MPEDFSRKQNHRGSARQIFFNLVVEKPLKNESMYTPVYVPFTAKRGHFRQSCQGKSCMWFVWRLFKMNRVMVGAVDEFFERFLTSTLAYLGLKTTPRGGFVLENFLIKKKVGPKTPIFFIDFQKMPQDFLKKQNYRGSAAQIFLTIVVEKPLKMYPSIRLHTSLYVKKRPFSAKL